MVIRMCFLCHASVLQCHSRLSYSSSRSTLWQDNRREYNRRVKEVVEQSWIADDDDDEDGDEEGEEEAGAEKEKGGAAGGGGQA